MCDGTCDECLFQWYLDIIVSVIGAYEPCCLDVQQELTSAFWLFCAPINRSYLAKTHDAHLLNTSRRC